MISYNGCTYSWNGRKLEEITNGNNHYSYTYNANGIRTSKTVNGITTEYFLNGEQILAEKTGDDVIWYFYDVQGQRIGLMRNNTTYYYLYDLTGNVIALVKGLTGNVAATYAYDAWGNCTIQNVGGETIGTVNPFRYKGYYHDEETGLYYVSSRYYDPEVGRFINADSQIAGVRNSIQGFNLFAYCFNNPVNMNDKNGNWSRWITATVAVVAMVIAVVAAPAIASIALTVAVISTVTYVAQSHHYDKRQAKNTNLPQTKQEADSLNWINSNRKSDQNPNGGGPAADCHQYSAANGKNIKYVSPDGHREVIFNSAGNIVSDPRDIGTYNICPSSELWYSKESLGHLGVDIIPWIFFGNNDDDWGPIANWIIQLFE